MKPDTLVVPPPMVRMFDYPGATGLAFGILFTTILLFVAGKFDPSGGALTISLLVVIAMIGVVTFCLFYTVPNDEITSGAVGGLIAAFGAVIAHWIGRTKEGPK
jgi:membrane-associated phospholipid phosphatase